MMNLLKNFNYIPHLSVINYIPLSILPLSVMIVLDREVSVSNFFCISLILCCVIKYLFSKMEKKKFNFTLTQ